MKKLLYSLPIAISLLMPFAAHADITTGLVGWWQLDEGTGTTANDSSGNSNTGTLENGASWASPGVIYPYTVGLNTTGNNSQFVDVGNGSSLQITGSFTLSTWVYLFQNPGTGVDVMLITKDGNTGRAYTFDYSNSGTSCGSGATATTDCLRVYINGGSPSSNILFGGTTTPISLDTWTMVTATYASTTGSFALYINGVQEASSTGAATSVPSSPVDAEIGAREYPGAQEYISAYMNDARIYDRALSSSDVAQLYLYTGLNYQSFSVYAGNIFKIFKGSAVNIY